MKLLYTEPHYNLMVNIKVNTLSVKATFLKILFLICWNFKLVYQKESIHSNGLNKNRSTAHYGRLCAQIFSELSGLPYFGK